MGAGIAVGLGRGVYLKDLGMVSLVSGALEISSN